ncbi:hypothetical protein KR222_009197 [Zaprionus bogoriensis]|nr:hypothetical protein KR222_009197 [Zaprionus bogoriensis]
MNRSYASLTRCANATIFGQRNYGIRTVSNGTYLNRNYVEPVPEKKDDCARLKEKFMFFAKPNIEIGERRCWKYNTGELHSHSLNNEFKSEKARSRWSEFRRRMIYGNFVR